MRHYKDDPRKMAAKFTGRCKQCNCKTPKGSTIYYWPKGRLALCEKCGEEEYRTFLSAAQDEAMYSGTHYESDYRFSDDY